MQYRLPFLMLLMTILIGNIQAQHQATSFKINFNVDEHVLDKNDEATLNELVAAAQKASYYEISLTAHTDSDADAQYNVDLSNRRATSVKNYLLAHQLKKKALRSSFFGESKPGATNATEEGKAANRRVDITLNTYHFNSAGDVLKHASPAYKQEFTIDASQQNTIKGKNGTAITIPANAIQTKSGKAVTGQVNIVMQEFLKPSDAAFNQLSTISGGRMLESGGMFAIQAYANGEELELKKNASMKVAMPTINMKNNMTLFTAVSTAKGITEWQPTNVPFRPNIDQQVSSPPAFVKLNTARLKKMMVDCKATTPEPEFYYTLPALPKRPEKIGKAPKYNEPSFKAEFPWWQRLLSSNEKLQKEFTRIVERSKINHARSMAVYEKRKARLEPQWEQYLIDSARFEHEELARLKEWLQVQEVRHEDHATYKEQLQWNMALLTLIDQSNSNTLSQTNMKEQFVKETGPYSRYFYDALMHQYAANLCYELGKKSMSSIVSEYRVNNRLSLYFSDAKKKRGVRRKEAFTFAQMKLNEHLELLAMLDIAKKDLIRKRVSARAFDESNVGNVYATSLSSFGTFNCDRFSTTPQNAMVTITLPFAGEARVAFFVPEFNSYMYANRDEIGYSAMLPKGTDVKVIFVSFTKEEGPVLQVQQAKYAKNTIIDLKPKSVTLKEMQKELASI